jgi:hypothetical protein
MNDDIQIYALRDRSGRTLYVGRTASPNSRLLSHRRMGGWRRSAKMIILQACEPSAAKKIEHDTIHRYKLLGECRHNKSGARPWSARRRDADAFVSIAIDGPVHAAIKAVCGKHHWNMRRKVASILADFAENNGYPVNK